MATQSATTSSSARKTPARPKALISAKTHLRDIRYPNFTYDAQVAELQNRMAAVQYQVTKQLCATIVTQFAEMIRAHAAMGENVMIRNLGAFRAHYRGARRAHNPTTGEIIPKKAWWGVKFHPLNEWMKSMDESIGLLYPLRFVIPPGLSAEGAAKGAGTMREAKPQAVSTGGAPRGKRQPIEAHTASGGNGPTKAPAKTAGTSTGGKTGTKKQPAQAQAQTPPPTQLQSGKGARAKARAATAA